MQTDSAAYPILIVQPEWVLESEAMGSKRKFWYCEGSGERPRWLFKYPQAGTGQHWAEKLAAEIAACLEMRHAMVELALFQGARGSATKSFVAEDANLYHGNQILERRLESYDPAKRFRHADHTLTNIFLAIDKTFQDPRFALVAKERIATYLVLDALIGNTDRHHENWGILRQMTSGGWRGSVAPTFDHASSLGRELADEGPGKSRRRLLDDGRIGNYAEKGHGGIYWDSAERRAPCPLELVRRASAVFPEIFRKALLPTDNLEREIFVSIVERVPLDWMSEIARSFTIEFLCYNLNQLKEIKP